MTRTQDSLISGPHPQKYC